MPTPQRKPQLKTLIEPRWAAPKFQTADNQPALLPRIRREKLRRALYAACERAPLGWETQL